MLIQKVKLRCIELEKEIEEFKLKFVIEGIDDIIKVLIECLDVIFLEKVEIE